MAKAGRYRDWSFREVEEYYRQRYFSPEGREWKLSQEVMSMVSCRERNLAEDTYPAQITSTRDMDLIVCRNVMIYFDKDHKKKLIEGFSRILLKTGFLFIGHSETLHSISDKFSYMKIEESPVYVPKG